MTLAIAPAKIHSATIYKIRYILSTPYKLSFGTFASIDAVLLKLVDETGLEGWGEANPHPPFTEESAEDVVAELKELLPTVLGLQTWTSNQVDKVLDARIPGQLLAKGSVTMALLDLEGKRCDKPVAELLGPILRRSLPVLWPAGNGTASDDIEIIDAKFSEGYRAFMLKMGAPGTNVQDEVARVAMLRKRYGDTVKLIPDANAGWTTKQAVDFLRNVPVNHVVFVEQPLHKSDIHGMATLRKETDIPLSLDESLTSLESANDIVRLGAANIFSIKSSKNGGPLRARALSKFAADHGVDLYFNSMLEGGITQAASLHHAVTVSNLVDAGHAFMSTKRLVNDPTNFSSFVKGGMVTLPDGPGLGIKVDEDAVRKMATEVHHM